MLTNVIDVTGDLNLNTVNNYIFSLYFYDGNFNGRLHITIYFIFPYEKYDVL